MDTSNIVHRKSDHEKKRIFTRGNVDRADAFLSPITIHRPQKDDAQNIFGDLISHKKISQATTVKPRTRTKENVGFQPFFPNYRRKNSPSVPSNLQKEEYQMQPDESDKNTETKNSWDQILDTRTVVAGVDLVPNNLF